MPPEFTSWAHRAVAPGNDRVFVAQRRCEPTGRARGRLNRHPASDLINSPLEEGEKVVERQDEEVMHSFCRLKNAERCCASLPAPCR